MSALRCPICGKPVDEASLDVPGNSFPFCSPRCRLIDLGRWIDGKYQIPVVDDGLSQHDEASDESADGLR